MAHVDYQCHSYDEPDTTGDRSAHARVAQTLADESLDLALGDGGYRDHVALFLLPKIRPGGCWSSKKWPGSCARPRCPRRRCRRRRAPATAAWADLHALAPDLDEVRRMGYGHLR
jgi:hypothetical protein